MLLNDVSNIGLNYRETVPLTINSPYRKIRTFTQKMQSRASGKYDSPKIKSDIKIKIYFLFKKQWNRKSEEIKSYSFVIAKQDNRFAKIMSRL